MTRKRETGRLVGGEGGYPEMLEVDGREPDVSWTSRRQALEAGLSDGLLKMLGAEDSVTLSNRELDRLKVIAELLEKLFEAADAKGLQLGLLPSGHADASTPEHELLTRLRRWVIEIR